MEPGMLKQELAVSPAAHDTVVSGRKAIDRILHKEDKRLLVIVGPCSIHDEKAAYEYAGKIQKLREQVSEALVVVMRVYFEKPRTSVGWKGLINDPRLDSTCDILEGLHKARRILLQIRRNPKLTVKWRVVCPWQWGSKTELTAICLRPSMRLWRPKQGKVSWE